MSTKAVLFTLVTAMFAGAAMIVLLTITSARPGPAGAGAPPATTPTPTVPTKSVDDVILQEDVPESGARFGRALATGDINGDGLDDLVVGALNANVDSLLDAGEAFVYLGGSPFDGTPDFTLHDPNPEQGAFFGRPAVGDINGDGKADVIIGAFGSDLAAFASGEAFVFLGGSTFDAVVDFTLRAPSPQGGSLFGFSVATGDINGDTTEDVIIGAPFTDIGAMNLAGEAYVFLGGSPFNNVADFTLQAPTPQQFAFFAGSGWPLATGDVNGDGRDDIVVAASDFDASDGTFNVGEAYLFFGGDPFDEGADLTLENPSPAANARFGLSVEMGDVDGDGKADVLVGAHGIPDAVTPIIFSGEVSIYLGSSSFDNVRDLVLENPKGIFTGFALAAGDVNGDQVDDILASAPYASVPTDVGNLNNAGLGFLYLGGSLLENTADRILQDPKPEYAARLGWDIVTGDLNGDKLADVIVGAPDSDVVHAPNAGQVFIIFGKKLPKPPLPSSTPTPTPVANAVFEDGLSEPLPIPDQGQVTNTIEVADSRFIHDLNVSVDISHTWVGDLVLELSHEQTGQTVVLVDQPGKPPGFGCSGDDMAITLDDAAGARVEDECASLAPAIAGTFRPNSPLGVFKGESMAGGWTLTIFDEAGEDAGVLNGWSLIANLADVAPPIDPGADTDRDGCADGLELDLNPLLGGRRDPYNFWDFFDPNRDRSVTLPDFLAILRHFGAVGDPSTLDPDAPEPPPGEYWALADRGGQTPGGDPWDELSADGFIGLGDFLSLLRQFGHTCA